MKKIILSILALSLFVLSCSNDDDMMQTQSLGDYENGILIVGEGGFTTSGAVSFVSNDLSNTENQVYFNVNNEDVGSFFQSIGFNGDLAYLVVDNGNILVVNRYTFVKEGEITAGLSTPRYITFTNGKGYVSNWGDPSDSTDDFVAVIDLSNNTVETTISVPLGPERVIANANKVYVSHKGAYGTNNIVTAINVIDSSVATITLDDKPDEMIINNAGQLVVLSKGAVLYDASYNVIGHTQGSINKIDMVTNTVSSSLAFANSEHPSLMAYDDGTLYYVLNNNLYALADSDSTLPTTSTLNLTVGYAYGMSVKDNMLYVNDASFSGQSELLIYNLASGVEINSFDVALGASKIYFN